MPPFLSHAGASDISLQQKKKEGGVLEEQSGVGVVEEPAEGMEGSRDGMCGVHPPQGSLSHRDDP